MQLSAIETAMAAGAPTTCATCRRFHEGNMFCGRSTCGGPGAGRDFPDYDGPIPREKFAERCLVCGAANPKFVIAGLATSFRLCSKHKTVFKFVGNQEGSLVRSVTIIAAP